MMRFFVAVCAALVMLCGPAQAEPGGCTLVVSYPAGKVLAKDGDCTTRRTPVSSFKFPLAVMGFDSSILTDAHRPMWPWPKDDSDVMEIQKKDSDPAIWMKDSIVWYSQRLTREMGMDKFRGYVDRFGYGNRDLSAENALTHSWLMSSLAISPEEQIAFLQRFMNRELGVSDKAYEMTAAIMPVFIAGDWTVQGKTGSGWLLNEDGSRNKNRPQGWFVGWARKGDDQTVLFARLFVGDKPIEDYAGPHARMLLLNELPLLAGSP
jgi:beta-lactamase class D